MIRVKGKRGSGKTTILLKMAQENEYVIVEPDKSTAEYVQHMAEEKGIKAKVISISDMYYNSRGHREKYLVDELDAFLSNLSVVGYSEGLEDVQEDTISNWKDAVLSIIISVFFLIGVVATLYLIGTGIGLYK